MVQHPGTRFRVVLYEGEGSIPLESAPRRSLLAALLDKGYSVVRPSKPGGGTPPAKPVPGESLDLVVLGRFEGSAPELEDAASGRAIPVHEIGALEPEQVLALVEQERRDRPMNQPGQWKPWFPVIDYDRCTNCMQCLSFCLFDVYGVSEDNKIQVQNNDNCKTNCPACSRVCPEVAIMFPKYKAGPINGEPVSDADVQREKMKVDISALLGGDIYSRLRQRSEAAKSRFSTERDSDKALAERKRCLTKLAAAGDIPAEVLASLPSPDEIQRRAEAAAAKAKAALAANA